MTALNAILRPDAAYLISDGECWDGVAGQIDAAPRPKVLPLPHLNAAIGVRGGAVLLPTLYSRIVHYRRTFEDAAAHLGDDLRDAVESLRRVAPNLPAHDVVLAGWPETRPGPECWVAFDVEGRGQPPFEAVRTDAVYGPNDGTLLSQLGGRNIFAAGVPFDVEADAVALIEAQAAMPESYVGGFCHLTTILQDSITTRILRRWPETSGSGPATRA